MAIYEIYLQEPVFEPYRFRNPLLRPDKMENSGASQQSQQPIQPQQQSALIRAEQVKKLPHLNDMQKGQYEQVVQRLWDAVNSQPQNSENWTKAYQKLSQISKQLMTGMRTWQQNARQQQQAANAASQVNGAAGSGGAASNPQQQASNVTTFNQLNPTIQARVNSYSMVYPPTVKQGTQQANDWLNEAKLRFGQALQRLELGKAKMAEMQKLVQNRNQAGNPLQPHEVEQFQTKMTAYKKTVAESNSFLEKFKMQQNSFRQDQQNQQQQNIPTQNTGPQIEGVVESVGSGQNVTQPGQGPAAHTISSAVNAARNQASAAAAAQAVMSPTTQASPTAPQSGGPGPQSQPQNPSAVAQSPYSATSGQADLSGTAQAAIQQQHQQPSQPPHLNGPPRPLSQSAAVQQAAQNYASSAANNQTQPPQSATTVHGHPPYMQQGSFMKKDERMKISPHLNTKPHEPVQMAPARPTLTGGPSVGAIGQMGQPAIPKMPGYVLEGAGNERVLSKNKLNELVREITGAGPEDGDQLSPEAEEVCFTFFC